MSSDRDSLAEIVHKAREWTFHIDLCGMVADRIIAAGFVRSSGPDTLAALVARLREWCDELDGMGEEHITAETVAAVLRGLIDRAHWLMSEPETPICAQPKTGV